MAIQQALELIADNQMSQVPDQDPTLIPPVVEHVLDELVQGVIPIERR